MINFSSHSVEPSLYLTNILTESWFDIAKDKEVSFNIDKVVDFLYFNTYENSSYLIGKTVDYYFLSVSKDYEDMFYTHLTKANRLGPLFKTIKHYKVLHANTPIKTLVNKIIITHALEDIPEEKQTVRKI